MKTTQRIVLIALVFALIAGSLLAVDGEAKRKRRSHGRANANIAQVVNLIPDQRSPKFDPNVGLPNINPGVLDDPDPDPCDLAESALDGFLPKTVTLKKTETYWAKLTVNKGVSVLACDLSSGEFEVKFNDVKLRQYAKVPYVGGWNSSAPTLTCALRVGFELSFSHPGTVILSDLEVRSVNCANSPNWLDNSVVKDGLNAVFPDTIAFSI